MKLIKKIVNCLKNLGKKKQEQKPQKQKTPEQDVAEEKKEQEQGKHFPY